MAAIDTMLSAAASLGNKLNDSGFVFVPANGHFQELCRRLDDVFIEDGDKDLQALREMIKRNSDKDQPNGTNYRVQREDLAALYIRPCLNRIHTLRHRLIPLAAELAQISDKYYQKNAPKTPGIIPVSVPALFYHARLREQIKSHMDSTSGFNPMSVKAIGFRGGFDSRTEEEVLQLVETGVSSMNDAVVAMVAEEAPGWAKDVYDRYFITGVSFPTSISREQLIPYTKEMILCYLILTKMVSQNIIDSSVNISLDEYRQYIAELYMLVGGMVYRQLDTFDIIKSTGEMLIRTERETATIYVYENTYQEFMDGNGDVDAILGAALVLTMNTFTVERIRAEQDHYASAYQRWYKQQIANINAQYVTQAIQCFCLAFTEKYSELDATTRTLLLTATNHVDVPGQPNVATEGQCLDVLTALKPHMEAGMHRYGVPYEAIMYALTHVGLMKESGLDKFYEKISQRIGDSKLDFGSAAFLVALDEVAEQVIRGNVELRQGSSVIVPRDLA